MRKAVVLMAALAIAVAMSVAVSADDRNVAIRGGQRFIPNERFVSNFHFAPGAISRDSGQTVTWVDQDEVDASHTITVVEQADVPVDPVGLFLCREPGGVCRAALDAHFGTSPPTIVVNVGAPGLDQPGDSLLLTPTAGSISEVISAPAGTTLWYLCALHPWMQGTITVA